MKEGKVNIFLSFPVRLSFYVVLVTAVIFSLAFCLYLSLARNEVKDEAENRIRALLTNHVQYIDGVLRVSEILARNASAAVLNNIDNPDSLYSITRTLLKNNPDLLGSAIAVDPGYYPHRAKYFSPYSYRAGADSIVTVDFGSNDYPYADSDWFQIPKQLETSRWSEPYFDKGGAERIMTTYSQTLKDVQGRFFGVLTIDISLEWLSEMVGRNKPYPNSNIVMVGRSGTYLIHKEREKILNETIFTPVLFGSDTTLIRIGKQMLGGESGSVAYTQDGERFEVFYAPIARVGWSVALVCRSEDIFEGMNRMQTLMIWTTLAGLLVLLVVCVLVIRRSTKSIVCLSHSAERIATGDFRTPLPEVKINDEIGALRNSFGHMQHSLSDYIDRLRRATEQEEKINSELRIASQIQLGMVTRDFSIVAPYPDLDVCAAMVPAKEVGGDLYDLIVRGDKLYLLIGDVAGKGVPASLMMAVTLTQFRVLADRIDTPRNIVESLNHAIIRNNTNNMFVTLVVGIYDIPSRELTYCNAGHNPMVLVRGTDPAKAEMLDVLPNLPAGIIDNFEYVQQRFSLASGDTLFFYTDGLTEAENRDQQLYSEARMLARLERVSAMHAGQILDDIQCDVKLHVGDAEPSDDLTMLVLKINRPPEVVEMQFRLGNRLEQLSLLEPFVSELGRRLGLPEELSMQLNLVLEEVVVNIISYGQLKAADTISLEAGNRDDTRILTVSVIDNGIAFDPTRHAAADISLPAQERPIGGLGIHLVHRIMDSVTYQRDGERNILTLKKRIRN